MRLQLFQIIYPASRKFVITKVTLQGALNFQVEFEKNKLDTRLLGPHIVFFFMTV